MAPIAALSALRLPLAVASERHNHGYRITVKSSEDTVFAGAPSSERTSSVKESTDLSHCHCITAHMFGNTLAKLVQCACTGNEACTMGPSPRYILVDCVAENHTSPSKSMSATWRRASSCTLA